MIERVDELNEGQQYFVIHRRGAFVEGDLIYVGDSHFKYPNGIQTFQLHEHVYYFYRYVSNYQYYMALKEKYNQTCLDIVLKRLVNENFSW
jgi:hypothetical protein